MFADLGVRSSRLGIFKVQIFSSLSQHIRINNTDSVFNVFIRLLSENARVLLLALVADWSIFQVVDGIVAYLKSSISYKFNLNQVRMKNSIYSDVGLSPTSYSFCLKSCNLNSQMAICYSSLIEEADIELNANLKISLVSRSLSSVIGVLSHLRNKIILTHPYFLCHAYYWLICHLSKSFSGFLLI